MKRQRNGTVIGLSVVASGLAAVLLALFFGAHPVLAAQEGRAVVAVKKSPAPTRTDHRVAMQVDVNDPAIMNLVLNNASNVAQYYERRGEKVEIEIVAFGPGLHMLREDTSPVKERIKSVSGATSSISFKACGNTQQNMRKLEDKDIPLVSQATVVKSGVVRLMELQERGWSYIRP